MIKFLEVIGAFVSSDVFIGGAVVVLLVAGLLNLIFHDVH